MWASPFVLRVRLALSLKGVSYEYVEEDLKSKSELLLKSNPVHTKVPVLIHNGEPVCESSVILQYIDEAFAGIGPSLLPADPHDRAVARFWASYIDDKSLNGKTEEEKAEGAKQAAAAVETLEGALMECSKGKPFFGGDSAGYVDLMLGGLLPWIHVGDTMKSVKAFDPATTPLLAAWADSFGALDAVEPFMPEVSKLVEFAMAMMSQAAAATATN
ncbi:hypothetical protein QYE76_057239 [Lolium multiflorum]|uniref:Glutathione S-transferase n=1 Tax=Lolium multiflorum TaxID=4521 RepID=A0AAD8T415_LOLMU|nr:hypothetical protein QYE76_057239 [Lolium multiflorum]